MSKPTLEQIEKLLKDIKETIKKEPSPDAVRTLNDTAYKASFFILEDGLDVTLKDSKNIALNYGDPKTHEDDKEKSTIHPSIRLMTLAVSCINIIWDSHGDTAAIGIIASMLANARVPFNHLARAFAIAAEVEEDEKEEKEESPKKDEDIH